MASNSNVLRGAVGVLFATAVAAAGASANAQDGPPSPSPVITDLQERFVGSWTGSFTQTQGDESAEMTITSTCESAAAGWGMRCEWAFSDASGVTTFVVSDVWGFSADDGLVHWYAVTNGGEVHDHRGGWAGDVLTLEHNGPHNGQVFSERIVFTWTGPGSASVHVEIKVGAATVGVMDGTMTRVP